MGGFAVWLLVALALRVGADDALVEIIAVLVKIITVVVTDIAAKIAGANILPSPSSQESSETATPS